MHDSTVGNTLRFHRRRAGITQREMARLLGYRRAWQVSRHERSRSAPPLMIAFGYQEVLGVPMSELFRGMRVTATQAVDQNLAAFHRELQDRTWNGGTTGATAHKLKWLIQRTRMA